MPCEKALRINGADPALHYFEAPVRRRAP